MLNKATLKQLLVGFLPFTMPASADPRDATQPLQQIFADWQLVCHPGPCEVHTEVDGADGRAVLRLSADNDILTVATDLPLFLPDGLALGIGDAPEREAPWRTCDAGGCAATLPLDPDLLAALRRERAGAATFTLVDGVPVRLTFSLMGFTDARRAQDRKR